MFNMPRIWIDYAEYAAECLQPYLAREVYDKALKTLPVTQHSKVWKSYVQFAIEICSDEELTKDELELFKNFSFPILYRYVRFEPKFINDLMELAFEIGAVEELISIHKKLLDDPTLLAVH